MKTLITRVRSLLVLLLCAAPLLMWATAPSIQGLSITAVTQLSFAKAQIKQKATDPRFTQTATSPYSKGAISYRSTQLEVATVDASTGEVTPKKVGETRIVATQAAAGPFLAATAEYVVQLTGDAPVLQPWILPAKTFGEAASYVIGTGQSNLPPPQSTSDGSISYRLKDPAMATIATVATQNNVTTVTILKAGTVVLVAEQAATQQYTAGSTEATLLISAVPTTVPAVTLAYGASQTLINQVPGVAGAVTYRVADSTLATVSGGDLTINARGVGSTTLFAVQNGVNVASGPLTVIKGAPVLSSFPSMSKTVNDIPFDLAAISNDLVTGAMRTAPVRYDVTASNNSTAVTLLGDRGQTVWIAQGGTVEITATQEADANHNAAQAKATLTIGGEALPWVKITKPLPGSVMRGVQYEIRVLTNSPNRLGLGMMLNLPSQEEFLDSNYWKEMPSSGSSQRGPNIEDVYTVQFDNNPSDRDIPVRPILGTPDAWSVPGFPTFPFNRWPLGDTTLSRYFSEPVAFPRGPYTFTYGTTPSAADTTLPSNLSIDDSSVNSLVAGVGWSLIPNTQSYTYFLTPSGVGSYTLKGWIEGHPTSTTVTVLPQATNLSPLNALTLTMDSNRVEVFLPQSSRIGAPATAITYQIADPTIAKLVTEGNKYYVEPVSIGTTRITATQEASGTYAKATVSADITVTAGAPPITVFLPNITATYSDRDVEMPLPTTGFDPAQGGITFTFSDTTVNIKGSVASAALNNDKIRIGFLHAGVTTLTVSQGANQAITTITVNKAVPILSYASAAPAQLQQNPCFDDFLSVWMPRLNEGLRTSAPDPTVVSTAQLTSTSDGAISYSLVGDPDNFMMRFGGTTFVPVGPYDKAALIGAHPHNMNGMDGQYRSWPLMVRQAEAADHLAAQPVTVPDAFQIRGLTYMPGGCPV